jgi:hypothetical protein
MGEIEKRDTFRGETEGDTKEKYRGSDRGKRQEEKWRERDKREETEGSGM